MSLCDTDTKNQVERMHEYFELEKNGLYGAIGSEQLTGVYLWY